MSRQCLAPAGSSDHLPTVLMSSASGTGDPTTKPGCVTPTNTKQRDEKVNMAFLHFMCQPLCRGLYLLSKSSEPTPCGTFPHNVVNATEIQARGLSQRTQHIMFCSLTLFLFFFLISRRRTKVGCAAFSVLDFSLPSPSGVI